MSTASKHSRALPDGGVATAVAVLASVGLVTVYSATAPLAFDAALPPHFVRHATAAGMGLLVAVLAMRVPLVWWQRLAFPIWGVSVALLVATFAVGVEVNHAQRWLAVPGVGIRFQPSELVKWSSLLAGAAWIARLRTPGPRSFGAMVPLLLLAAIPAGLLWQQPDTGSAVLLVGLMGLLAFVAGTPLRLLNVPAVVAMVYFAFAMALRPYVRERVHAFWDPWAVAGDEGFQLVQSFVAFGRGGALGVGLGDGRQKLFYLPEAHTDFALSVVAEEAGLLGVALVLGAFAALLVAGCRAASRAHDRFALLVIFGMTSLLTIPAILNAAVVMGMVPPKGLALPFISYGRSSLLVSFLTVGTLLGAMRQSSGAPTRGPRAATPGRAWRS